MVINTGDLTFSGEQIKELSEAVFQSTFEKPEINAFHTIVGGVKAKQQIALLGVMEGLTGLGSGACDPASNTNQIGTSEKQWNPKTVSNRFESCWTDLKESFFIYGTKNGIAKADLTATDYFLFLEMRMKDALAEEVYRVAWFSDTAADNAPDGNIKAGINLGYFNKIDGFFKQLYAIVAADSKRKTAGLGSRNNQLTFSLQSFTSSDTASRVVTNTLQNMRYGSDFRLRGKSELQYIVTQSVSDQYERELKADSVAFTTEKLENGIMVLKCDSIEVISFQFWDRIITQYEQDGTAYFLPHRALLTVKENTQIATEEEASLSEMDVFYDKKSKKNYIDSQYDIDAKIVEDYLVQVAY